VKLNPDGFLARLEARLVVKKYSQVYGMNYHDTFSPVEKLISLWILIFLTVNHHRSLHQLDVKNVFLNSVLARRSAWSNDLILLLRES